MIVCPNAKINIGLKIKAKRPDTFHLLSGYFFPIQLNDILEINPASQKSESEFKFSGIEVPSALEDNLVFKAYKLMQTRFSLPNVYLHLHKQIPFGAGLGGGSSNASHTLILLNKLFELTLSNKDLKEMALSLGSDCGFFMNNSPSYVSGIGDKIEPIENFLKGFHIKLFKPNFGISTAEAYSGVNISGEIISKYDYKNLNQDDFKNVFKNDFEYHLFKKYPLLTKLKDAIEKSGAFYTSLTGSGSVIYGLYNDDNNTVNPELKKYMIWEGRI